MSDQDKLPEEVKDKLQNVKQESEKEVGPIPDAVLDKIAGGLGFFASGVPGPGGIRPLGTGKR